MKMIVTKAKSRLFAYQLGLLLLALHFWAIEARAQVSCVESIGVEDNAISVDLGDNAIFGLNLLATIANLCPGGNSECVLNVSVTLQKFSNPNWVQAATPVTISSPGDLVGTIEIPINSVDQNDAGTYRFFVEFDTDDNCVCDPSMSCANATSPTIQLTVTGTPPTPTDCIAVSTIANQSFCPNEEIIIPISIGAPLIPTSPCATPCIPELNVQLINNGNVIQSITFDEGDFNINNIQLEFEVTTSLASSGSYQFEIIPDEEGDCPTVTCNLTCNTVTSNTFNISLKEAPENLQISAVGGNTLINCENTVVTLEATASNFSSIDNFDWKRGGTTVQTSTSYMTLSIDDLPGSGPTATSNFSLIAAINGCTTQSSPILVSQNVAVPTPVISIGNDNTPPNPLEVDCTDPVPFDLESDSSNDGNSNGNNSLNVQWYLDGNPLTTDPSVTIDLSSSSGVYTLEVQNDVSKCWNDPGDDDEIEIQIDPDVPMAVITPSAGAITCDDPEVTLNFDGSNYLPGDVITLTLDGNDVPGFNIEQPFTATMGGTYILTVNRGMDCDDNTELDIIEDTNEPGVQIAGDTEFCPGDSVTLAGLTNADNPAYLWTLPDGSTFDGEELKIPAVDSSYVGELILEVENNDNGCVGSADEMITLKPAPLIEKIAGDDVVASGEVGTIELQVTPANSTVSWVLLLEETDNIVVDDLILEGNTLTITDTYIAQSSRVAGVVTYGITATEECTSPELRESIIIGPAPPVFPEVVVLNAASGTNWNVVLPNEREPDEFSIKIFNRAACIVYEGTSLAGLEDFVLNNCPDGAYYYVVFDESKLTEYSRGAFTVIGSNQ